jgi:protein-tyrosine phosphatase
VTAAPQAGPRHFLILFVCARNMCRSVLAERLAARELGARALGASAGGAAAGGAAATFAVSSAGVATRDGLPMHPGTARVLARLGVSAEGFRTRCLTACDVERADLVLTAGAEQLNEVVAMLPGASRRTYRLREFAWLASAVPQPGRPARPASGDGLDGPVDPVRRARLVVAEAARRRGRIPGQPPGGGELPDPVLSDAAILDSARVIEQAVRGVIDALCAACGRPAAVTRGPGAAG